MSKSGPAVHYFPPRIPIAAYDWKPVFFDKEKERLEMHLKAGRKTWAEINNKETRCGLIIYKSLW